jgi:hypothetical protein
MSLLAQLIARREGFYIPGSIPRRRHNPGDLTHAPGEHHPTDAPDSVGSFGNVKKGWAALTHQLLLFAERKLTLQQAIDEYAPASVPGNDPVAYVQYLCAAGGWTADTLVSDALNTPGSLT